MPGRFAARIAPLTDIRQIAGHFGAISGPIEARCKEIQLVADGADSQIVGLTASKS
jgi:hypothetical protein